MAIYRLRRWFGPLAAGAVFVVPLIAFAIIFINFIQGGIGILMAKSLKNPIVIVFAVKLAATEVLPVYITTGLVAWMLLYAWGLLGLDPDWRHGWRGGEGFLLVLGSLGWIHLGLWWQVPTALWVIPGLDRLPFWAAFPVLGLLCLLPMLFVVRHRAKDLVRGVVTVTGWVGLSLALGQVPNWLPEPHFTPSSNHQAGLVMLAIDGLRPDVAESQGLSTFHGTHYPNVYTVLPATRMVYSMLWGGDPQRYTASHAIPDIEELEGKAPYTILKAAWQQGLKTRFYIDDGGTIGLAGRTDYFDEVLMPARGWENYVNSNLAVHLPLYAIWLNHLRIFPSTHPWAPLDAGIRRALDLGRGADWVMFHSCLSHQPIFLDRRELGNLPRWWTLKPGELRPKVSWKEFTPQELQNWDIRRDTFLVYEIRVRSLLKAWEPLWNGLGIDPAYANATRVFFSDHGERFYHVTDKVRLQGIHGFDLDPWELRVPFVVAGPGFQDRIGPEQALSLLQLRDAIGDWAIRHRPIGPEDFISNLGAFMRYPTLGTDFLRPSEVSYRQYSAKGIVFGTKILPEGFWCMKYEKSIEERGQDVSLAEARGSKLTIFKPLAKGGAEETHWDGFRLVSDRMMEEAEFQAEKKRIEMALFRQWKEPPAMKRVGR